MNKADLVSLFDEGRTLDVFPDGELADFERGRVQYLILGVYSKRFSFPESMDKKEFYYNVLNSWMSRGYAKQFADAWKNARYFDEILRDLGLIFDQFSEE